MAVRDEIRQALIAGDVGLLWRMWSAWFPNAPQPRDWQEAEVQLHAARTATKSVPIRLRCYSHHWLVERSLPSMLPEELKPKAERYVPAIASGVGFAWGSQSRILAPAKDAIQAAVQQRILEMDADGLVVSDPELVRKEMMFAKNRVLHGLFGNTEKLKTKRKKAA